MHRRNRRRRLVFHDEIPVRNGVHAVGADFPKPQGVRHRLPVGGIRHPGQGAAAQRQHFHTPGAVPKSPGIPFQHLKIRQQMMGEQHRLRPLQMRIARHRNAGVTLCQPRQRPLHAPHRIQRIGDDFPRVQPQIQRNLVVAGTPGMQPPGGRPNQLGQPPLNIHMDVL